MAYTAKQWRAINYFYKSHNLRPILSARPFVDGISADGITERRHIQSIVDIYDGYMERQRRERSAERRAIRRALK